MRQKFADIQQLFATRRVLGRSCTLSIDW